MDIGDPYSIRILLYCGPYSGPTLRDLQQCRGIDKDFYSCNGFRVQAFSKDSYGSDLDLSDTCDPIVGNPQNVNSGLSLST